MISWRRERRWNKAREGDKRYMLYEGLLTSVFGWISIPEIRLFSKEDDDGRYVLEKGKRKK